MRDVCGGATLGTLTISVSPEQVRRILQVLREAQAHTPTTADEKAIFDVSDATARELRLLLNGRTESLVRFLVERGGEVNNSELAKELNFDNPAYTSSVLGKITGKLRRAGVQAEGRDGINWYKTQRVNSETLLRVRSDVLSLFKRALA
jgi:hypothetical protein